MPAQPIDTPIEAIRELERDRFRAMVDGDGELLDALLAENASYVHTNGKRETKRQFIDAITAGRRRYRQIEIQSQELMPGGRDTWIVYGRALLEMESKNGALVVPDRVHGHPYSGRWAMAVARDAGNTRGAGLAPLRRRSVGRRGSTGGAAPCERRPPCRYRLSCFIACFKCLL